MEKIQNFFADKWAINSRDYSHLLSIVIPSIKAGNLDAVEKTLSSNQISAYAALPYIADRWDLNDNNLPDNSVAVLNLEGVLYSWETSRLASFIESIENNDKIIGCVLCINGPGGMTSYLDVVADLISASSKPIAAFVMGLACSAHYWIASSCKRIFLASKLCMVGSIGIVNSYMSFKKYYETNGIDIRDIYANNSDLKNIETRSIEDKNDEGPMKAVLDTFNNIFCQTVSKNRNIPFDAKDPFFRGADFIADAAIANGYADQYGTLNDAISWVLAQRANSF